jgi:hypothetical protein
VLPSFEERASFANGSGSAFPKTRLMDDIDMMRTREAPDCIARVKSGDDTTGVISTIPGYSGG